MFGILSIIELMCMAGSISALILDKHMISLYTSLLLMFIVFAFINQVFKCTKKIKNLKNTY